MAHKILTPDLLCRGYCFAFEGHINHIDKGGVPYVFHIARVAAAVRHLGPEYELVGLFHDLVEDTATTLEEIREEFGDIIADGVDAMTIRKDGDERYFSPGSGERARHRCQEGGHRGQHGPAGETGPDQSREVAQEIHQGESHHQRDGRRTCMSDTNGWVLWTSPEEHLLFGSNDAARRWHAAHLSGEGSCRVLCRWRAGQRRWDPEWDGMRAWALEERRNILVQGNVEDGSVNWELVNELNAESDHFTSWEFESDIWQELEFISDVEAGRALGI